MMKTFLKVGSFLLGATLVLAASAIFVAETFFLQPGSPLTEMQSQGLLLMGGAGAVSIVGAILMEYA